MKLGYQTPGVYREEVILKSAPQLQTGVPGFIGFVKNTFGMKFAEPILLKGHDEFDAHFGSHLLDESFLADAIHGFFANGGSRCYVSVAGFTRGDDTGPNEKALQKALYSFAPLTDLDLIAEEEGKIVWWWPRLMLVAQKR